MWQRQLLFSHTGTMYQYSAWTYGQLQSSICHWLLTEISKCWEFLLRFIARSKVLVYFVSPHYTDYKIGVQVKLYELCQNELASASGMNN